MTSATLPSKLYKFFCILGLLLLPTSLALGKTLQFQNQTWEIIPSFGPFTPNTFVRNDFELAQIVKNNLLGTVSLDSQKMLSDETRSQLLAIENQINQPAEDAKLVIADNRATDFNPGQVGQSLDLYETATRLRTNEGNINLSVFLAQPKISLADTNHLGINELVAVGQSNFTGSPQNRIHNLTVGAQKFDGLIIAQNEEFSFNKYLGDVDDVHGFLPELVIKPEGVTPEFGGGLCQVSTTAFRATMNAGLPITARRNHSFAVQYYAPQGTDATIYPGSSNLKFINDLQSPLLIHTKIIGKQLYFEYYGTKDDRQVSFEGPTIYDKKPDGSMKATWIRYVVQNGQTQTQTFKSVYLAPALFHHDAVTQPATPNPEAKH